VPIFSPRKNIRPVTTFATQFTSNRPQNHHLDTPLSQDPQEKRTFTTTKKRQKKVAGQSRPTTFYP
jgi:hypothetical protein